jgi:hypothetical protein
MLSSSCRFWIVSLATVLWACSSAQAPEPTPPPQPAVSYDGRYVGTIRSVDSVQNQNWCTTPTAVTISVRSNSFEYTVSHPNLPNTPLYNPAFTMHIAPDGSFKGPGGELEIASMTGRITGTHMAGQIDGTDCSYAFSAERR